MKISPKEIQEQRLSEETLFEAVRQVREGGFVILEETMTQEWSDRMREAWDSYVEGRLLEKHTQNGLLGMPFIDPLAIENPWGVQILEEIMGKDFWGRLPYHCNSTAPNWPETQFIHRDQAHLFADIPIALPPHMMIIHIPLVDFTEENGSTEVWPGTHLITDYAESLNLADADGGGRLEERAATMPSVRTNMPVGSTLIRDMRVWHRGMPNRTNYRRTMLSLVYHRHFPTLPYQSKWVDPLSPEIMKQLSERAQYIFRFNKESAHKSS